MHVGAGAIQAGVKRVHVEIQAVQVSGKSLRYACACSPMAQNTHWQPVEGLAFLIQTGAWAFGQQVIDSSPHCTPNSTCATHSDKLHSLTCWQCFMLCNPCLPEGRMAGASALGLLLWRQPASHAEPAQPARCKVMQRAKVAAIAIPPCSPCFRGIYRWAVEQGWHWRRGGAGTQAASPLHTRKHCTQSKAHCQTPQLQLSLCRL